MQRHIHLLFVFLTLSFHLFSTNPPHLVLYFDVNKTLIASDQSGGKSVENVLNELLSETYVYKWDDSLLTAISFDSYIYNILIPGNRNDKNLKEDRKAYTHHFVDYLEKNKHPLHEKVLQDYIQAKLVLTHAKGRVLPSFYALLDYLNQQNLSYSIILRSFGKEIFNIKEEINCDYTPMFERTGNFREGKLILGENDPINNPEEIYQLLRRIPHTAISDDWKDWDAHNQSAEHAKMFIIDSKDNDTLSLFFDDNINETDSITNIISPFDVSLGQFIPIPQVVALKLAHRVDTLQAILNPDYYINLVQDSLEYRALKHQTKND